MFFLFQSKNDVTLDHIHHLFTLSFEFNVVSRSHTAFNFNNYALAFINKSFTLAVFTVFCINFATTLARIARLLHLHLHEAHIYHLNNRSLAFTFRAGFLLTSFCS
jgi:hypothetical protein